MARFTEDGHVKFSGEGVDGLLRSWNELGNVVSTDLRDLWLRMRAVRGEGSGGGGHDQGPRFEAGWFAARDNATIAVEKALGFPHAKPDDVPRPGTKERQGYDAGQAAALAAVLAIHPD